MRRISSFKGLLLPPQGPQEMTMVFMHENLIAFPTQKESLLLPSKEDGSGSMAGNMYESC